MKYKFIKINNIVSDYLIRSNGDVISIKNNKNILLKPQKYKNGYLYINLYISGKMYRQTIHRLVALAFINNPDKKEQINHIDGNKKNNDMNNLEWVTAKENTLHLWERKLSKNYGENCSLNKYSETTIIKVCDLLMLNQPYTLIKKETGVSVFMISEIKNKKIWKHITNSYNFPINMKKNSEKYPLELKYQIKELIDSGKDNNEIISLLDLQNNKKIKSMINRLR